MPKTVVRPNRGSKDPRAAGPDAANSAGPTSERRRQYQNIKLRVVSWIVVVYYTGNGLHFGRLLGHCPPICRLTGGCSFRVLTISPTEPLKV